MTKITPPVNDTESFFSFYNHLTLFFFSIKFVRADFWLSVFQTDPSLIFLAENADKNFPTLIVFLRGRLTIPLMQDCICNKCSKIQANVTLGLLLQYCLFKCLCILHFFCYILMLTNEYKKNFVIYSPFSFTHGW